MNDLMAVETNRPMEGNEIEKDDSIIRIFGYGILDEIEKRSTENPETTVLDIGCGKEGRAIEELARKYPRIKAIGYNLKINSNGNSQTPKNLTLLEGDLFDMKNLREKADVAYTSRVLFYIGDAFCDREGKNAGAFSGIAKTLKKGGTAYIDHIGYATADYLLKGLKEGIEQIHPGFGDKYNLWSVENERESDLYRYSLRMKKK